MVTALMLYTYKMGAEHTPYDFAKGAVIDLVNVAAGFLVAWVIYG